MRYLPVLLIWCIYQLTDLYFATGKPDNHGVMLPTKCEVCKLLVTEIVQRLDETKSSDTLKVGSDMVNFKKIKYEKSEVRLFEVLEDPPICNRLLLYKVHKERTGVKRFDKSTPQTMQSLHNLVNRGVDVKLDVPFELWDKPAAEVTALFKQCVSLITTYEETIEEWYFHHQDTDLLDYLCKQRILDSSSQDCLYDATASQPTMKQNDSHNSGEL